MGWECGEKQQQIRDDSEKEDWRKYKMRIISNIMEQEIYKEVRSKSQGEEKRTERKVKKRSEK